MKTQKNTLNRICDDVESITSIEFSIYGNNDIVLNSAIADPNGISIGDVHNNGVPIHGGVSDKRMGVTEPGMLCDTCGETTLTCPGHFGHAKLAEPCFHMGYLPYVKKILQMICIRCKKLKVYKTEESIARLLKNKQGKQRFAEISAICKKITHCQKENYGCGTPSHKITIEKKNGNVLLIAEPIKRSGEVDDKDRKKTSRIISPQLCYDMFKSVPEEVWQIMGFDTKRSKPEDMIIVNFPIPPPQVHPSIKMEILSSSTMDDDLTHKLTDIIKANINLKNAKGDGSIMKGSTTDDDFMFLQLHVATFFANDILGLPKSQQKNKKVTKSLSERLKGKEGRIRGNLMGKRTDMSGRTVITSDPNIELDEVGVPLIIAMNLTYPEIVTEKNIKYLQKLVNNGSNKYPGANSVTKKKITDSGLEIDYTYQLNHVKIPVILNVGDVVKRHLQNGDTLLFNRQPSLHKMSMMGHRAHILKNPDYLTFRVNVNITDPYNADFDGDEMNIHVPGSIQTIAELRLIASATKRFVSPATSKIAIKAKQDSLMGSHMQTVSTTRIDWKDAMNILMATSVGIDNNVPKNVLLSGNAVYTNIIPTGLNLIRKKDDKFSIKIVNGQLLDGVINSSEIAAIIQKTWFQSGSNITRKFIDNLQRMILQFLMRYGYTVGIKDTIASDEVNDAVYKIIETNRKKALKMITAYENDPYIMTSEAHEINLTETLKASQDEIQKTIMANFDKNSGIYMAISSGSSGTEMNAGQIIGCIGQVIVESKRIQRKYNNRTLPMFYQFEDSAFSRGYCHDSFISGLNPMEFFFQVMAGREGIISTAIKTADTGYIQRKLIKILEDIKVEYDGTVRNANDKIIQCIYGNNGINTEKQIEQKLDLITANNAKIRDVYVYSDKELKDLRKITNVNDKYTTKLNEQLYNKLINLRDILRKIQRKINISSVSVKELYMMPVDIQQFINNIVNRENRVQDDLVDPYYVLSKIKDMYSGICTKIMKYNKDTSIIKKNDEKTTKLLLKTYIYDVLSPKKCTHFNKLSTSEFDEIVEYFKKTIVLAKVEGGEMVGFVGAQSIGEPVTQTNLKLFHKSGTGKTVAGGLVRVKELLGVTKNIKTPITKIILEEKYKTDKIIVGKIASNLKYTTFKDVVETASIYYDPNPESPDSIMVKDGVTSVFDGSYGKSGCQSNIKGLPWVLRLVLSKEKMIERNINMLEIKTSFCRNWVNRYEDNKTKTKEYKKVIDKISQTAIVTNFDNSPVPTVHIRFNANNYNYNTFVQFQEMIVNRYKIKGIVGITESNTIVEESYVDFDEEGNIVNKKQFVIFADGVNVNDIPKMNGIDLSQTITNDIVTIYEKYGVEAARMAFIHEFTIAIESSGGVSNYQHIELLADTITHMGGLIAVNRHGANKLDTDPFSRASFEKTVEQMLAAAAFGETDHIRSVSARIMVGALINGGTGCFDMLLDHDKIKSTLLPTIQEVKTKLGKKTTGIGDLIRRKKAQ